MRFLLQHAFSWNHRFRTFFIINHTIGMIYVKHQVVSKLEHITNLILNVPISIFAHGKKYRKKWSNHSVSNIPFHL